MHDSGGRPGARDKVGERCAAWLKDCAVRTHTRTEYMLTLGMCKYINVRMTERKLVVVGGCFFCVSDAIGPY